MRQSTSVRLHSPLAEPARCHGLAVRTNDASNTCTRINELLSSPPTTACVQPVLAPPLHWIWLWRLGRQATRPVSRATSQPLAARDIGQQARRRAQQPCWTAWAATSCFPWLASMVISQKKGVHSWGLPSLSERPCVRVG